MKTFDEEFEEKIKSQVDLKKTGVYEASVNEGELRTYVGLGGNTKAPRMLKIFTSIFDGEIISLSFSKSKAVQALLVKIGFETLEELFDCFKPDNI
jgi:hypothetical protein